jgi:hypothetical protein
VSAEAPRPAGSGATLAVSATTVEEVVRARLSEALGGRRGMLEAAVPTLAFTVAYLLSDQLRPALILGVAIAAVLVVLRAVQRSTMQFALNSLVVMGLAAYIASRTGRAEDVFLPGIIWNAVVAVLLAVSVLVRWPFIGLLIGTATGDLSGWRREPAVLKLCTRLTLIFLVPNVIRLAVQLPLYLAGKVGWLAAMKLALGWPLYIAVLAVMVWVLARGHTPLTPAAAAPHEHERPPA